MAFTLPELPFARDALAPHMSEETLNFHYGKHHQGYVGKANDAIEGTEFEGAGDDDLEEVIKKASGGLFNSAAQIWNHTFFWNCLTPNDTQPGDDLVEALNQAFGSVDEFKKQFTATTTGVFGSGWGWLVQNADGSLECIGTSNAENPLKSGQKALLTCDIWEHAYYIDYRNDRGSFLDAFWNLCNWDFVNKNLET